MSSRRRFLKRDWLSEDLPNDELNRVTKSGQQHFGFPYCHQGDFADPQFGWGKASSWGKNYTLTFVSGARLVPGFSSQS